MTIAQVSEVNALASTSGLSSVKVSEVTALVSTGPPNAQYTDVGNLTALVSARLDNNMSAQVSQVNALVSYLTGAPALFTLRAWGFNLDQHQFYVIHLGNQGTFVYDIMTGQWAKWQTEGYVTWNMEYGVEWNRDIYAGSSIGNSLWKVDKYNFLDEGFRTITRVVTGGISVKGRETLKTGPFILDVTKQTPLAIGMDAPTITMSLSDDGGETYMTRETITVDSKPDQDIAWTGLGSVQTPGRVFNVTDSGGMVRINLATLIEAEQRDGK